MSKPQIFVDENVPKAEEFFGQLGEVHTFAGRNVSAKTLANADALVVRSVTQVNEQLLAESKVNFVGTCTIGIDHLDTAWLDRRDIAYTNAPGCNANSVVEYVLAALALLNINWQGKRVGIVGCGNVGGRLYAKLASLGAQVAAYDPLLAPGAFPNLVSLEEVFSADIVCLHAPLTTSGPYPTRHMIGRELLAHLPIGATLISAGRGPVVCNESLLAFANVRADLRLVLDVWEHEPWLPQALLARAAIGTPHIAGYSYDGKVAGTEKVFQALASHWGKTHQVNGAHTQAPGCPEYEPKLALLSDADWQQVRRLVCNAYDIAADDQRLRDMVAAALKTGAPDEAIATGFDLLRKTYPVRREFRFYQPVTEALSEPARAMARAIGFQC
ncbi:4-phosphoerythronate dehydrogenase [Simiduia sp. 21SJ11W-1]|uniref:4-phosphoerythronate dehydrogenase n=1 Tax=Simiduia sp. 21SJ11W-1 TaxID=2909669 RepID=UPI00209C90BC|nr:4-phosphoerythronate dehydrogenase [Simiduia sp. 21SJ11W-1]UTA46567.1 4-phosphoerythronate dehydrogenase [Simiduia sp. 21SJ11W-1]